MILERSAAAATVRIFWPTAKEVVRKNRVKVIERELDNLTLIFNNEVVLRAAGNGIRQSAEAKH